MEDREGGHPSLKAVATEVIAANRLATGAREPARPPAPPTARTGDRTVAAMAAFRKLFGLAPRAREARVSPRTQPAVTRRAAHANADRAPRRTQGVV